MLKLIKRMVIIISNISNIKIDLLYKINKKKFLNDIKKLNFFKSVELIEPLIEWEIIINQIYNIDFPVYKKLDFDDKFIYNLNNELKFNNNSEILLPFFNETQYWIKAILLDKYLFLKYLSNNNIINNITIISVVNNKVYDIEVGENEKIFELRINSKT